MEINQNQEDEKLLLNKKHLKELLADKNSQFYAKRNIKSSQRRTKGNYLQSEQYYAYSLTYYNQGNFELALLYFELAGFKYNNYYKSKTFNFVKNNEKQQEVLMS